MNLAGKLWKLNFSILHNSNESNGNLIDSEHEVEMKDEKDVAHQIGSLQQVSSSGRPKKLCDICNTMVNAPNMARHRAGIAHKELEVQRQMGIPPPDSGALVCRKCNVSYNTFEKFRYHLKDNPSHKSLIGDPEPETDMDTKVVGA